jgi:hypothetical protein
MILAVVAACAVTAACSKKNSLYLEPGRAADAQRPAPPAPKAAPPEVQKASQVEPSAPQQAQR